MAKQIIEGRAIEYAVGSDNIFADLGLPNPEERLLKAQLSWRISRIIEAQGLTQTQAAARVGLTQPKLNDVLRGRLAGYSVARLLHIINRLGLNIEIRIERQATSEEANAPRPHRMRRGVKIAEPPRREPGVTVVV